MSADTTTDIDLADALTSWVRRLKADRKSEQTVRAYRISVETFLTFCDKSDLPRELSKHNLISWLANSSHSSTTTVRMRLAAVKRFAQWLEEEEDFDASEAVSVRAPKAQERVVAHLSDNELQRLVKSCDGSKLRDKRDKAMVRLLTDTGLRAAELLALDIAHVDLDRCVLVVHKGKGGKSRAVSFSVDTASAVDRYLRARRRAAHRNETALWVSERGYGRLTYGGLVNTMKERAQIAGVSDFHVHRLRHTTAVRWLRSGGSEVALRAHCGWSDKTMVAHYTKSAGEELAAQEFKRLNMTIVG
jgi:integrase/recombinase XerD